MLAEIYFYYNVEETTSGNIGFSSGIAILVFSIAISMIADRLYKVRLQFLRVLTFLGIISFSVLYGMLWDKTTFDYFCGKSLAPL